MANETGSENFSGNFESPGGHIFGIQGWHWGDQKPSAITFFLDGTVKVSDQHGRPIKGVVQDSKPIYFIKSTHRQVIEALKVEHIDWRKITHAGWPQLPYDELKALVDSKTSLDNILPPTPLEELRKIPNKELRKAAIKMRQEIIEGEIAEMQAANED